ncbi:MAG: hypothetical protein E4G89_01255 [Methanothrix sp.]|nr:MAG: hypothetical protein E4G89_01255 [Methanothrix sp.]
MIEEASLPLNSGSLAKPALPWLDDLPHGSLAQREACDEMDMVGHEEDYMGVPLAKLCVVGDRFENDGPYAIVAQEILTSIQAVDRNKEEAFVGIHMSGHTMRQVLALGLCIHTCEKLHKARGSTRSVYKSGRPGGSALPFDLAYR